ncbi:hypothetical protein TNCV_2227031 [Trichonephila clavipes]|uniref:Uncharacterized protein n=1 Tax=Trichonephila clavipes TaxID=2585209 RepID=A0A8X6WFH4_TRICX|nr:hypothetical protein TNCV_2227031 [Trichonephila clavipes]
MILPIYIHFHSHQTYCLDGQNGPATNCRDIGPCNPPCKVVVTGPCPVCDCVKCDFSNCKPPCKHYKKGNECICDCD